MNRAQSIGLVRALAAASWADGRLERAEEAHLNSLAYRLGLTADDLREEIEPLIERQLTHQEAMDTVGAFMKLLGSDADRHLFLDELRALLAADGKVSEEEAELLADIEKALADYGALDFVLGKLRSMWTPLVGTRVRRPPPAELLPYVRNKVLAGVQARLEERGVTATLTTAELNRAALFGALLARVATAGDHRIDEREERVIRSLLEERGGLEGDGLEVALAVLFQGGGEAMDRQRLCAELNRITTLEERRALVADLFAVAGADAGPEAQAEIRLLANFLWIPARDFADLRAQRSR